MELDSRAFGDYITRFAVPAWDAPAMLTAEGWTPSRRILLFEFWNAHDNLQLKLIVGPGPERIRRNLLNAARDHPEIFGPPHNYVESYYEVLSLPFLRRNAYEEIDEPELAAELRRRWTRFLEEDLLRIDAVFKAEAGVWESGENNDPPE